MQNETPNETMDSSHNPYKKILIWLTVLFITLMLLSVVILQPRFFTFLS